MPSCWGITDGTAGMTSQVRALAQALGVTLDLKMLPIKKPWDWVPNIAYATPLGGIIFKHFIAFGDVLNPPYPDVIISCGRRASMAALGLKAYIKSKKPERMPRFIHIHHPCVPLKCFDLVVTVDHDKLDGANVLKTRFALHSITPATLAEAKQKFAPRFAAYPEPRLAVLLGGTTNAYDFTVEAMAQVVMTLQRLPGSLLITPSRRTGDANISMLKAVFASNPRVYIYDEVEENPYMGMLALAETIVVSNDSVNMMTDAAATGKPVYILNLPGHKETKQARFAEGLIKDGIARPLTGKIESWSYQAGNEMEKLAEEIKRRLAL
jgi:mitochondrial fission protein ELM1